MRFGTYAPAENQKSKKGRIHRDKKRRDEGTTREIKYWVTAGRWLA
jgi:hypothetical protein